MIVICPTRGRPDAAREVQIAFDATKTLDTTQLIFAIDYDDPRYSDYVMTVSNNQRVFTVMPAEGGCMNNALNTAALTLANTDVDILGFIGDDHRFRTHGWDDTITKALERIEGGLAYADDLAQREQLPTQVFISARIVQALGWMGLPGAKHLFLDNTWKTLGSALNRLVYLPSVVIEHVHPAYGKAQWDEGYVRVNSAQMYSDDQAVYARWLHDGAEADIAKVRAAL